MKKTLAGLGFALGLPIILVSIWWVSTVTSPNFFVPTPPELVKTFIEVWIGPALWEDVLPSVLRFLAGSAIAIVLGILLGVIVGLNRTLRDLTEPVFEFFRALPPPVLIPVLLLLFGLSNWTQIMMIVIGAIWPVLLNTIEGVRAADSVQSDTSRSYGIQGFDRVRYQILPSASPQIFTGIRQALPIGLMLMIISELFAATEGLGFQVNQFQRRFAIPEMWSGILVLGLLGILVAVLFRFVERRVLRWYHRLKDLENAA